VALALIHRTVTTLFTRAVFLSPTKMNVEPREAMIHGPFSSGSFDTVARSLSLKEPSQTGPCWWSSSRFEKHLEKVAPVALLCYSLCQICEEGPGESRFHARSQLLATKWLWLLWTSLSKPYHGWLFGRTLARVRATPKAMPRKP
jgi:hypothetical protein